MHSPTQAARRAAPSIPAVVLVALVLVGCTAADEAPSTAVGSTAGASAAERSGDADGALCVPPECGTSVPFDASPGYVGPPVESPDPAADVVRVVDTSLVTAGQGDWWGQGLVQVGAQDVAAAPVVRATLLTDDGSVLAEITSEALVAPLSAGETAPFRLDAPGVAAETVADVRWSGTTEGASRDAAGRDLQVDVFWTRPAGDAGRPVDVPGYADAPGVPLPLVLYAGAANTAPEPVPTPGVVAAFVDGQGRVVAVAAAPVLAPGTTTPLERLEPGAAADAVLVVADGPPGLDAVAPRLWGTSR